MILHFCPFYSHGTTLNSTPKPAGARCPDLLLTEALLIVAVVSLILVVLRRYRAA